MMLQPGRRHRPPLSRPGAAETRQRLRGLLPVLLPPRNGGAGEGRTVAGRARGRARLHPCASGNLGSDFERRRSAGAFGAADQGSGGALAAIDHLKVIRCIPACRRSRRNGSQPRWSARCERKDKATFVVLHVNHPRELTKQARAACARLIDAGIPMLSQSVLLRGVNDDAETLGALMRTLVECRIKPYYLHHADLAPGTAHLRTTIAEGQALMRRSTAATQACASRPMCSTSRTVMANRRSVRTISTKAALWSKISRDGGIVIRRALEHPNTL